MSIFDGSRAVRVIFRKWVPSENQRYLENGWPRLPFPKLALDGQMIGLHDRLFWGAATHLSGSSGPSNLWVRFLGGLSLHLNHLLS